MKKLLLGIAFSATLLTGLAQADSSSVLDRAAKNAIAERIKPTGTVCIQGEECATSEGSSTAAVTEADTAPAASTSRTGKDIFDATCSTCHGPATASAIGAPEIGKADDWQPRIEQGFDTVLEHSINGLNAMPAKGTCADCTDEEMTLAIQYMVKESTGDDFGPAVETADAEEEPADDSSADTEEAANGAADAEEEATEAEEDVAATEESAGRSGEEIYNASCTTCHATGIAAAIGAPEMGKSEDWEERLAQGFDTLLEHSINGLNAMPPKGTCADCTDEEMKAVVEYMVEQSK